MTSFYRIIKYLPDPSAGECINFGILTYNDHSKGVHCLFLSDWRRVERFAGHKIDHLKHFASDWMLAANQMSLYYDEPGAWQLNTDEVARIAGRWANSIQITEERASLLPPEMLLSRMGRTFLKSLAYEHPTFRTRLTAGKIVRDNVRDALMAVLRINNRDLLNPELPIRLEANSFVKGMIEAHQFDAELRNGAPKLLAQGLSFEGTDSKERDKDISRLAWSLSDIRQANADIPIGIIYLPPLNRPASKSENFERVKNIASSCHVELIPETNAIAWSRAKVESVAIELGIEIPNDDLDDQISINQAQPQNLLSGYKI